MDLQHYWSLLQLQVYEMCLENIGTIHTKMYTGYFWDKFSDVCLALNELKTSRKYIPLKDQPVQDRVLTDP